MTTRVPILIRRSLSEVSDQVLMASGVAMVRRKLARLSARASKFSAWVKVAVSNRPMALAVAAARFTARPRKPDHGGAGRHRSRPHSWPGERTPAAATAGQSAILARALISQQAACQVSQAKCVIRFAVQQQTGVRTNRRTPKQQLYLVI